MLLWSEYFNHNSRETESRSLFDLEAGTGAVYSYQDLVPSILTQHWLPDHIQAVTTETPCTFLDRYPSVSHEHISCTKQHGDPFQF